MDHPNERSLHATPVPRTGGLAIITSLALGTVLLTLLAIAAHDLSAFRTSAHVWILGGTLFLAFVSFWSDRREIPPAFRLLLHCLAAAAVVIGGGATMQNLTVPGVGEWSLSWLAVPFTIMALAWMTNLYNFMDGMDGFAGGMSVLGFGFLGFIAFTAGSRFVTLSSFLIVLAVGGFLVYNWPPAKIFLGDVGSILLGFLAGTLSLLGVHQKIFDLWVPVLIFSPFIVDASITLVRRLLKGERVWQAHRQHYYQRLVLLGWSHRKTVLAEYSLMIVCGVSAVSYHRAGTTGRLSILVAMTFIYGALAIAVSYAERSSARSRAFREHPVQSMEEPPKQPRLWWGSLLHRRVQVLLDILILVSAFALSYLLRFDFEIPQPWLQNILVQLPYVVLVQFLALSLTGGRSFIWRYTSITHLRPFLYAAGISFLLLLALRFGLPLQFQQWRVPVSVGVMDTLLAFGGVLGVRVGRRVLYERFEKLKRQRFEGTAAKKRVLLIGAGQAGVLAASEIERRGNLDLDIRGFVDDDHSKLKRRIINEIKVLGTTADLPRMVRELNIDYVVITIAQASRQSIQKIVTICEQIPVKVRIIPGLYEILQGNVEVTRLRDVQIEDLLGREPVRLDEGGLSKLLTGKRVLVTGAGGSIGSELARQVTRFNPAVVLLVDRAENALFHVDRDLRELAPDQALQTLVADIADEPRIRHIFDLFKPEVVLHAAAHKHVPLMEFNPAEAVKNNVLATSLLGRLADEFKAEVFVLVSTDKAVSPSSVMGATKRVAELVVQDLNGRSATRFVAVRFGNVIGSAGSVIPIFKEQIRRGGPVTITDKRMQRYFMTIPEAAQLVLQAGAMGQEGKGGEVFILHMGEPVSIPDLAEALITLSGLKPHEDIQIVEIGARPGEKLYEKLVVNEEEVAETKHPKIFINKISHRPTADMHRALERLTALSMNGFEKELRDYLNELLPEANLQSEANSINQAELKAASRVAGVDG